MSLEPGDGPVAWGGAHVLLVLTGVLTLASFLAGRGLWGDGMLQGGSLLPAPDGASDWWRLYIERWHQVGLGSDVAAAPFVALLALPASLLLGKAWLVVDLVMLFAVPLAAIGAYVAARRLVTSVWTRLWMAASYAVLPVVTGAFTTGHFGTVAATIALPWLVRAAIPLFEQGAPSRWRSAWATGLALSVVTAFAPVAWPVAAALVACAVAWWLGSGRLALAPQLLVALAVPLVLLLPWSLRLLAEPGLFLTEAGLVGPEVASTAGDAWQLPLGRLSAEGAAPWWLTSGILVAAGLAILRRDRRAGVAGAWVVLATALVAAATMAHRLVPVPGTDEQAFAWVGFPVIVGQGAAVVAVGLAADGITRIVRSGSFGWRQPVTVAAAALAVTAPLAGLAWWVAAAPHGDLVREAAVPLPEYMADAMRADQRVLVVDTGGAPVTYQVLADDGRRLGDDSVVEDERTDATELVTSLLSAQDPEDVKRLAELGIAYVVLPAPVDLSAAAELDGLPGLSLASTDAAEMSGWHVEATEPGSVQPVGDDVSGSARWPWLLVQAVCWLAVLVMAAPGVRRRSWLSEVSP